MAKLKAPLLSLGAAGAIGKALVFFPWKGIDAVREYVVPSNLKSTAQQPQRGFGNFVGSVAAIHVAQALAAHPLGSLDLTSQSLLASTLRTPMTWFNMICRTWLKQRVAGLRGVVWHGAVVTEANTTLTVSSDVTCDGANEVTEATLYWGPSKTNMPNSMAMIVDGDNWTHAVIVDLTNGTKYYCQIRPTVHADFVGANAGIFHGTPHA